MRAALAKIKEGALLFIGAYAAFMLMDIVVRLVILALALLLGAGQAQAG